QCLPRPLDRRRSCFLPGLRAGPDQLDDLVDALCHVILLVILGCSLPNALSSAAGEYIKQANRAIVKWPDWFSVRWAAGDESYPVVELPGLQRPGDLVGTEEDAGRRGCRADEFERVCWGSLHK